LSRQQFAESFRQLYPDGDASKFSEYVFNTFDLDKSGFISFHEFLLAISALSSDDDLTYRLHMLFALYDLNASGGIDGNELERVLDALFDLKGIDKELRKGDNSASSRA
jgi:Ca2+-binding EF-hand superfamily protein